MMAPSVTVATAQVPPLALRLALVSEAELTPPDEAGVPNSGYLGACVQLWSSTHCKLATTSDHRPTLRPVQKPAVDLERARTRTRECVSAEVACKVGFVVFVRVSECVWLRFWHGWHQEQNSLRGRYSRGAKRVTRSVASEGV